MNFIVLNVCSTVAVVTGSTVSILSKLGNAVTISVVPSNTNKALFISSQDDICSVPLGVAAAKGHKDIVEKLLLAGAVVDYQNKV